MMDKDTLIRALIVAKVRNPDAWEILGAISGLGEKVVSEIAYGKREPSMIELSLLGNLARA